MGGHAARRGRPPAQDAIAALAAEHGVTLDQAVHTGAPHGYSMADTSRYDERAARRHEQELRAAGRYARAVAVLTSPRRDVLGQAAVRRSAAIESSVQVSQKPPTASSTCANELAANSTSW